MADRDDLRQARLALALRANLRRRKTGERQTPPSTPTGVTTPPREDRD